uniref:Myb/SANT-like domain-containing protein n=1 Tax=Setaria italica TaxID=4555 RepID=K3Y3H6_SETIT
MNHNRANWDKGTMKTLLDLCIDQKNQFNWSNICLSKLGWKNMYHSFNQQTGLHLGSKQLQNKLNALRRTFLSWRALQNQSSLGHDTQTGDRGTLLTAGGIRESTPRVGTEGNAADLDQDPMPTSSARNFSKRSAREFSVDSPQKKRSGSLEQYIRDLSESVAKRSQKHADRAQGEMYRAMQLIKEDGLQEGSPLYCHALYLCTKNPDYRRAFTKMKTKEGRLNWIQFN